MALSPSLLEDFNVYNHSVLELCSFGPDIYIFFSLLASHGSKNHFCKLLVTLERGQTGAAVSGCQMNSFNRRNTPDSSHAGFLLRPTLISASL